MAAYPKAFAASNFTQLDDGRFVATLLASTHGLGTVFSVTRVIRRRDADLVWENVIPNYEILPNGDFNLYTDEPGTYRIYLMGD